MNKWYARSVFFVSNAENSIRFYTEKLGFVVDWNYKEEDRAFVCQVSRDGFELILAQNAPEGRSRVFLSIDAEQERALRNDIAAKQIETIDTYWGMPILAILDLDKNELFFSPPNEAGK